MPDVLKVDVIAVVPILPALYPLFLMLSWGLVLLLTLLGIAGNSEQRRMLRRFLWKQRFSLMVIFALFGLGWYGFQQAIAHWTAASIRPLPVVLGEDWPMFRGGPARTGAVSPTDFFPASERLWSGGYLDRFYASPAVVGNQVYCIGSRDHQGCLFCWNDITGELQWVMRPEEMRATFSSPVIVGQRLLCGEGLHTTTNARVFCLDLSQPEQPALEWSFETRGHVEGTPVVANGRVFVSAGDDGLYALSLSAMGDRKPALLWHLSGQQLPDVETALLADDEYVYAGSGQGGHVVVMLEAATGREVHRFPFDFPVHAPPAVHENRLYVGMGEGDFVNPLSGKGGAVACIELATRQVAWTFTTPATVLGAITISEGEIVFGCADGLVRVLSEQGDLKQSWNSGAPIVASLAVTPKLICGVNTRGRLFLLDRPSLDVKWQRDLGTAGYFISSPVLAGNRLFVGTEQYGFQCFGEPIREHP